MPGRPAYRTSPQAIAGMPSGVPYIVGNEAAERFSYYGMKAILVVFMTTLLVGRDGSPAPMNAGEAKFWYLHSRFGWSGNAPTS
jgi:POT family proton-dependent oligopeptide transporter